MTQFEQVIKAYLDDRAARDPQFAVKYANEKKSIEECCKFIEAEVCDLVANKSGAQSYGMTDDEVYGLAVHYYDEADIKPKPMQARSEVLKTNIIYEATEQEKEDARNAALKKLQEDAYNELRNPKPKKAAAPTEQQQSQMSLF